MIDLIWIILNIACLIVFIWFIKCENENTKVRKEQIEQLKKESELLDRIMTKVDRISKLQASYEQVKDGGIGE